MTLSHWHNKLTYVAPISINIPHTGSTLKLSFSDTLNGIITDESWAVLNENFDIISFK